MGRFCVTNILVITVLFTAIAAKPYDVESILKEIPAKDRIQFIKHYVKVGYELSGVGDYANKKAPLILPKLPSEFSVALYNYVRKVHQIQDDQLINLLENIICFPNGECIDVGDVGIHPK